MAEKKTSSKPISKKLVKSIREQKTFTGKVGAAAKGSFKNFLEEKKNVVTGGSSTVGGTALHLLGAHGAKKWYETFFGKKKPGSSDDGDIDEVKEAVAKNADKQNRMLQSIRDVVKSHTLKLKDINANLGMISEDVSDIKALLMPKVIIATGRKGGPRAGQERAVAFNPLAPSGAQMNEVTTKGKILARGPGKEFADSATQKAAMATAQLALKIAKKDQERGEMRKKNQWKDPKEVARVGNPVAALRLEMNEKFDKVFAMLEEIKGESKDSLGENVMEALGILRMLGPFAGLFKAGAAAGLVALSGYLGYKLGEWLNDTFKLDEKINNLIDTVMGFFGKGNDAKAREATKTDKFSDLQAKTNAKLEGTGYKLIAPGQYQKEDGTIFKADELSGEVQDEFARRGLAGFKAKAPAAPPPAAPAAEPDIRKGPSGRGGPRGAKPAAETTPPPPSIPPPAAEPTKPPPAKSIPSAPPSVGKKPSGEVRAAAAPPKVGSSQLKSILIAEMDKAGITGKHRAALLAQTHHETGGFKHMMEDLRYRSAALKKSFSFYKKNPQLADEHAGNAELIARHAYANRMGNGDPASGDGWKYRGRGFIQLTGKDNYRRFGDIVGMDLVSNPDLAANPQSAAALAVQYYKKMVMDRGVNPDDTKLVTKIVNGGDHGLSERTSNYSAYLQDSSSMKPAEPGSIPSSVTGGGGPMMASTSTVGGAPSSSATTVEKGSRELQAANAPSQSAPVVVNAPTVNNQQVASNGPKHNLPKASATSNDDSLIRMTGRDAQHPVYA